jgi:chromosome segregation ATPase
MAFQLVAKLNPALTERTSASPALGQVADDVAGVAAARRLSRELESIEASLLAAEQSAIACRPTRGGFNVAATTDVESRRAELARWEMELQERERAVERHRMRMEQVQARLHRAKESLKRAIFRFRAEVAERSDELDARARQLAELNSELVASRRQFARELMQHKAATRKLPV